MKGKIELFFTTFVTNCIIFLTWHGWELDRKEILEMVFIGILSGLIFALVNKWFTGLVTRLIQSLLGKKN